MTAEVQGSVNDNPTHLIDRQSVILWSIILHSSDIDIYLTRDNMLRYPTLTLLKGDDIGIVVVAYKVAIHLAVVLRATENIVNVAHLVTLTIDNLLYPTAQNKALGWKVVAILIVKVYHCS
jgi:hypothetical protein